MPAAEGNTDQKWVRCLSKSNQTFVGMDLFSEIREVVRGSMFPSFSHFSGARDRLKRGKLHFESISMITITTECYNLGVHLFPY